VALRRCKLRVVVQSFVMRVASVVSAMYILYSESVVQSDARLNPTAQNATSLNRLPNNFW